MRITNIEKDINKMESFFKHNQSLYFLNWDYDGTLTWETFLELFFKELNGKYYSIQELSHYVFTDESDLDLYQFLKQDGACLKNKNRSLGDIYSLVLFYFPQTSLYEVMGWLYEKLTNYAKPNVTYYTNDSDFVGHLICDNIRKRVFHNCKWYGSHEITHIAYQIKNGEKESFEVCDENGFYFKHYWWAYKKYKNL